MTDPIELSNRLSDQLKDEAPRRAPDRVLLAALSTIDTTPQRHARVPWRISNMNPFLRVVAVAAAALAIIVVPLNLLPHSVSPGADASPSATPSSVPAATLPGYCVTPADVNALIDLVSTGGQDPGGDPVACYGNAPLTFNATWLGGGEADCPTAPEPAWLACASFGLQAPGDTRKVGPPTLFVAVDPSASLSIPSEPYAQVRVTGHFDDPAAQTCHETQLGDAATLAPAADTIERCRMQFVVTEAVGLQSPSGQPAAPSATAMATP